jgi:hypothetical protein
MRAVIFLSSAGPILRIANEVGHMSPSSRFRNRVEADGAVAHLELARRLHEDADFAVARPAGHAVVRLRGEHRRVLAHDRVDLFRHLPLVVGKLGDRLREGLVEVLLLLRRLPLGGGRPHRGTLLGAEPALLALLGLSHGTHAKCRFHAERRPRSVLPDRQERVMSTVLLDAAGRRRSPATMPGFHSGRPPRNKGRRYPADPPQVEEIVAVMREAGTTPHGLRMRGLIVVLWRAGLRIHEALALTEADLDARRGSVLVRRGKGGRRREVGMDDWAWEQLQWTSASRCPSARCSAS